LGPGRKRSSRRKKQPVDRQKSQNHDSSSRDRVSSVVPTTSGVTPAAVGLDVERQGRELHGLATGPDGRREADRTGGGAGEQLGLEARPLRGAVAPRIRDPVVVDGRARGGAGRSGSGRLDGGGDDVPVRVVGLHVGEDVRPVGTHVRRLQQVTLRGPVAVAVRRNGSAVRARRRGRGRRGHVGVAVVSHRVTRVSVADLDDTVAADDRLLNDQHRRNDLDGHGR